MSRPHSGSEGFGCLWLCKVTQMLACQYPSTCEPTNKVFNKNIRKKKGFFSFNGTSTLLEIQSAKWESYMHSVSGAKLHCKPRHVHIRKPDCFE